jgi:hypothetical protein
MKRNIAILSERGNIYQAASLKEYLNSRKSKLTGLRLYKPRIFIKENVDSIRKYLSESSASLLVIDGYDSTCQFNSVIGEHEPCVLITEDMPSAVLTYDPDSVPLDAHVVRRHCVKPYYPFVSISLADLDENGFREVEEMVKEFSRRRNRKLKPSVYHGP